MYVLLIVVCPFVLFLLAIVLSVLLRDTDSDYSFGIFKLFLYQARKFNCHVYVLGVSFVPIFLQFFNWILELLQQCGIHVVFCFHFIHSPLRHGHYSLYLWKFQSTFNMIFKPNKYLSNPSAGFA